MMHSQMVMNKPYFGGGPQPEADRLYRIGLSLPMDSMRTWLTEQDWLLDFPMAMRNQLACAVVPIATFGAAPRMEDTLLRWLHRICMQQPAYMLTFTNLGAVPPGHWYLRSLNGHVVKPLVASLRTLDIYLSGHQYPGIVPIPRIGIPLSDNWSATTYMPGTARLSATECYFQAPCCTLEIAVQKGDNWTRIQQFSLVGGQ